MDPNVRSGGKTVSTAPFPPVNEALRRPVSYLGGTRHGRWEQLGRWARDSPVGEGRGYPCGESQSRPSGVLTGDGIIRRLPQPTAFRSVSRLESVSAAGDEGGLRHAGTQLSSYRKATSRRVAAVPHPSRADLRSRSVALWCCFGPSPEKTPGKGVSGPAFTPHKIRLECRTLPRGFASSIRGEARGLLASREA